MNNCQSCRTPPILLWRLKLGPFEFLKEEGILEPCRFVSFLELPGPERLLLHGQVDHRSLLKEDSVLFGVFIIHIELLYIQAIPQEEKNSGFISTVGFGYPVTIVVYVILEGVLIMVLKVTGNIVDRVEVGEV